MASATRHITVGERRYLIRGDWSPAQLRQQYTAFQDRYASRLTFQQWLVQRGKVYLSTAQPKEH